jgi:hypothetical protein
MTKTPQKTCFRCGVSKPLTEFYAHPGMADGRLGKCKDCAKNDVKTNRDENPEYYQNYERSRRDLPHRVKARTEYAQTAIGKESGNRAKKAWAQKNPDKRKAQWTLSNALRDGKLIKAKQCSECGAEGRIQGHHPDYAKPLEVIWLCTNCHGKTRHKTGEILLLNVTTSEQVMAQGNA